MNSSHDQRTVEATLTKLGIQFERSSEVASSVAFTSLRAPRASGIYYITGDTRLPVEAVRSLIITDAIPPVQDAATGNAWIRVENPQLAFYSLMRELAAPPRSTGVHPSAIIDPTADVPADAYVGPYCVIEGSVKIGTGCTLDSHVVLKRGTVLGNDVVIEPHSTLGATGVAWVWDNSSESRIVQPQTGGVQIGDGVFLGSDVTIVRGSVNEITEIGPYSVIAHGSKVGHGCRLGRQVHLANNVTLAGNVDAGDRSFFGSGCVVHPRVRIADGVIVGAGAVVHRDVDERDAVMGAVTARKVGIHDRKLRGVPAPPEE